MPKKYYDLNFSFIWTQNITFGNILIQKYGTYLPVCPSVECPPPGGFHNSIKKKKKSCELENNRDSRYHKVHRRVIAKSYNIFSFKTYRSGAYVSFNSYPDHPPGIPGVNKIIVYKCPGAGKIFSGECPGAGKKLTVKCPGGRKICLQPCH